MGTHDLMAYDDLRTGRLVIPVPLALPSGRSYNLVCPKRERRQSLVEAFSGWIRDEVAKLDWSWIYSERASQPGAP
jgi:LysR family glycine cleavage system transcriptional activator